MTRHESRCIAVCLLFEYSFGGDRNEILENAKEERGDQISALAKTIYNGTIDNLEEIDGIISAAVEKRGLKRIPRVVLAVLRDAVYELKFAPEPLPVEIIAPEAVEICREYGEHEMTGFVHGVIAKIVNG